MKLTHRVRWLCTVLCCVCMAGCSASSSCVPAWVVRMFIPKPKPLQGKLAQALRRGQKSGKGHFSHRVFDGLLRRFSDAKSGRFDYVGLRGEAKAFRNYLKALAQADLATLPRNEQMALLLNAYNAFTLRLILEHWGRIKSIREIDKPWKTPRDILAGQRMSLGDLEHRVLRGLFKDARIHFAINCASIGCPPLPAFAFRGKEVDAQLDRVSRDAIRNPRYVRVDKGTLYLTQIFAWYRDDFLTDASKDHTKGILSFVNRYADKPLKAFLRANPAVSPRNIPYNWKLNQK